MSDQDEPRVTAVGHRLSHTPTPPHAPSVPILWGLGGGAQHLWETNEIIQVQFRTVWVKSEVGGTTWDQSGNAEMR